MHFGVFTASTVQPSAVELTGILAGYFFLTLIPSALLWDKSGTWLLYLYVTCNAMLLLYVEYLLGLMS